MSSLDDFTLALNTATAAMASKANGKADSAFVADNALKLNGKTSAQLVSDVQTALAVHAGDTNNPHHTTAELAGAYDKVAVDNRIATRVLAGLIPLSRWGVADDTSDKPPTLSYLATPPRVVIGPVMGLMAGSTVAAQSTALVLTANTVNYIYFKMVSGLASYVASTTQLPETNTQMFIGTVTTNATTGVSNTLRAVSRLGLYRVSDTPVGSAIPVSGGLPGSPANLLWT